MTGKGALAERTKPGPVIGNGNLRPDRHIQGEIA
jgi:hypothetical protein